MRKIKFQNFQKTLTNLQRFAIIKTVKRDGESKVVDLENSNKSLEKIKKTLDKQLKKCYNKSTVKKTNNYTNERKNDYGKDYKEGCIW